MKLLHIGHAEPFKAGFHVAIGLLCAGAAAYNLAAYLHRRDHDKRLLTNTIIYTAGVGLEWVQVTRHLRTIRSNQ